MPSTTFPNKTNKQTKKHKSSLLETPVSSQALSIPSSFLAQHCLAQGLSTHCAAKPFCDWLWTVSSLNICTEQPPTRWASASSTQDLSILRVLFYRHGILRTNHLLRPRHNCIVMRNNSYRKHNIILIKQRRKYYNLYEEFKNNKISFPYRNQNQGYLSDSNQE